jgi:hypothetical protein
MAVAHDNATESDEWTGTTPDSQTHTPVGTPRGAIIFPIGVTATDSITASAYGAIAPAEVADSVAIDASSELGLVKAYFAGSSIPAGAQTCTLTQSGGNGVTRRFYVATVTASDDTEVVDVELVQDNTADPTVTIDTGSRTAITYVAMFSGLPSANVSAGSGLTALFERAVAADARTFHLFRETTPTTGSRSLTVNTGGAADDCALTAVAISEVIAAGGGGATVVRSLSSMGSLRSLVSL